LVHATYSLQPTAYPRKAAFGRNQNGTVTDQATGLIWQIKDSGKTMDWKQALSYAENFDLAGHDDWRLPNVKELQSIVDYGRAPDAIDRRHRGPAIDPVLDLTETESWFWSSTTHIENQFAYYVAFGQALSTRRGRDGKPINAHGAGAVRSDPKEGDPARWVNGLGPQADEIRILNFVRCVRGGSARPRTSGPEVAPTPERRGAAEGPAPGRLDPGVRFRQRLDRNGDGKVSRQEFDGPTHHFDHLDRNNDGFINDDEAPTRRRNGH